MPYTKTQQARLDLGNCFRCGAARTGPGSTNCFCATCAEKSRASCRAYKAAHPEKRFYPGDAERNRLWKAKRREARLASGVCVLCGLPKEGRARNSEGSATQCGVCTSAKKKKEAARRQRDRNREAGLPDVPGPNGRNARIWTMGRAVARLGPGAHKFSCFLDRESRDALLTLRERYKREEAKAGRVPKTHQRSRLVREAVAVWEHHACPVRRPRLLHPVRISVIFDAKTWGILQREAAREKIRVAQVLRTMLCLAAPMKRSFVGGWGKGREEYAARSAENGEWK